MKRAYFEPNNPKLGSSSKFNTDKQTTNLVSIIPFRFILLFKPSSIRIKRLLPIFALVIIFAASCKKEIHNYLVILKPNPERPVISEDSTSKLQEGHMQNIQRLYDQGKLIAAGPFEGGGGLFIIKAGNNEELELILSTDPAIDARRFIVNSRLIETLHGKICPVDSVYTMEMVSFLKLSWENEPTRAELDRAMNITADQQVELWWAAKANKELFLVLGGNPDFDASELSIEIAQFKGMIAEPVKLYIARETFCR